uniref:Uncharacterized protein n=1 Tax=Coprothermobacter proteolyticus (strain ATCC 35245 / DSM 5265 / OCM 4 / BT) TaxID=309798 RepID=B5Y954_COPPD
MSKLTNEILVSASFNTAFGGLAEIRKYLYVFFLG